MADYAATGITSIDTVYGTDASSSYDRDARKETTIDNTYGLTDVTNSYDREARTETTIETVYGLTIGGGGTTVVKRYLMRAWNLNLADWETWTSDGTPDPNPPSGDPVTNVTVSGVWEL